MKKLLQIAVFVLTFSALAAVRPPKVGDRDFVKLVWDYSQGSNPAVKFRVYIGTAAGVYDSMVETAGLEQAANIEITEGSTYYIVATAVSADGLESVPSNEVVYTAKARPAAPNNPSVTRFTIYVD